MADIELSRRAVIAGLCSALALAFAPLDRFMAGLGKALSRIFGEPSSTKFFQWTEARVTVGDQTFDWKPATWYIDTAKAMAGDINAEIRQRFDGPALASSTVDGPEVSMVSKGWQLDA